MRYAYSAIDAAGRRVRGYLDAVDLAELEARLERMALFLVRGKPARAIRFTAPRPPRQERLWFCFQLRQLLHAGVPLLTALADLAGTLEHPRMKAVAASLAQSLEGGARFSEALAMHPACFGPVFVSMTRAGESTGDLAGALEKLETALKWEDELIRALQRILAYPMVAAVVMLAATGFLLLYLVPQLQVFARNMGQTLPWHARALFGLSGFLAAYWHVLLIVGCLSTGAGALAWRVSARVRFLLDDWKLRLPVVGGVRRKIILARLVDTLALLYAAGIPVLEAIGIARHVAGNLVVERALMTIETMIRDGRSMAGAFADTGFFPPLVTRMVRVGETTGALDAALKNVGAFYSQDARATVARIEALAEPVLTLALGAVMAWIALSVIGPIYDMIRQFKV
ncbi:MAG: type II secretion system F family protein [Zoogloeaceae bacterium]|jgi:type IV pilus assembly protein PilC|nr:type II secretion system F family protein [Zoogloeaceae bacterium]